MKSYPIRCPKCNSNHSFYRYGKASNGYQKYLCRNGCHQFAPERPRSDGANCRRKHPPCPVCGKASFLHHDYEHSSSYRCSDKKCSHSFFVWKSAAVIDSTAEDPEERRKCIEAQENASNLGAVIGLAVGIPSAAADREEDMTAEENDGPTIMM